MRPILLQLDDALAPQARLAAEAAALGGTAVRAQDLGPALRLWSCGGALARLKARLAAELPARAGAEVVFAGSGDFHHVTPLLLERAIEGAGEPVTLVHFDNHPDWARFAPGRHCGSWVGRAARLPGVERVISVGLTSPDIGPKKAREGDLSLVAEGLLDLFAWTSPDGADVLVVGDRAWPTIQALGEAAFLAVLEAAVPTRAIYITVDKDVLAASEAVTNWDQGCASLAFLEEAIRRLARGRRLVGADVVGDWSRPVFGGGAVAALVKHGEAWLDQPRGNGDRAADAARINEAANLRLLAAFAEAAA